MSNLTILNTSVLQLDNLYSLNDLHRLSGNEDKHAPFRFMRNEQTQELIAEIQKDLGTPDLVFKIKKGKNIQGTYACKELVIAYAAWISPKFHLIVLRAFLNQLQPALPEPPKMYQCELTEKEMQDFCWAWYALRNYIELTEKMEKQLGALGGNYAYAIRQLNWRYRNLPNDMLPTLQRITQEFKTSMFNDNGWNRILHNVRDPNTIIRCGRFVHLF